MSTVLRTLDAASMGIHAMALLSLQADEPVSCKDIAEVLGVSEHHLAKVLQRPGKEGLVEAVRGPKGASHSGEPRRRSP